MAVDLDRAFFLWSHQSPLPNPARQPLLNRRDALLRTAGLATASLLAAAPLRGIAAQGGKPVQSGEIDAALQAKVPKPVFVNVDGST